MTGPIDTAYVEIKPDFDSFERELRAGLDRALSGMRGDIDRHTRNVNHDFDNLGRDIGKSFGVAAEGAEVLGGAARAAGSAGSAMGSAFSAGLSNVAVALPLIFTGLQIIVPLAAAATHAILALIAIAPAGLAVLGAAIAPLIVGFQGFGAAITKSAAAGGGASAAVKDLTADTYRLSEAQRQARYASENVTRAREAEQRRLEDLQRALVGAALDERGAQLSILEAEKRVREARHSGSRLDRQEAQLALDQARANAEDVRVRNQRLGEDQDEAAQKGVEGSDQVKAALEAQRQALHSVADAQKALNDARNAGASGGGGGIDAQAAALAALAPAARHVAEEFNALRPVFASFQRSVQQALFKPLEGVLTRFAKTTLPHIQAGMETVAGAMGRLFAKIGEGLSTPKAQKFFDDVFAATGRIIDDLSPAVYDFLSALASAVTAALPAIEGIGSSFGDALSRFAEFIEGSIKDGSFQKFIHDGLDTLKKIGDIAGSLIDFFKELFSDENGQAGQGMLDTIKGILDTLTWIIKAVKSFYRTFNGALASLAIGILQVIGYMDHLIGKFNAIFGPNAENTAAGIGKVTASIPGLAEGGVVTRPTLVMAGEGGEAEAIAPLSRLAQMMADNRGDGGQSIVFGPGSIQVSLDGSASPEQATAVGAAVGRGIIGALAARNIRLQARTV